MTTREAFADQPIRILVLNAARTGLDEILFRADLNARHDPGMPEYRIPATWKASVKHEGRSYIVTRHHGEAEWFAADVVPCDDDDTDEDEG